ncbi:MAG: pyridoxamine 5'-phosphate oxidase [Gammaproteobacteria bacterium]|nr:pyridoxamine 5'-phosphate oxidase [Gammaproteobacteria bacterium]
MDIDFLRREYHKDGLPLDRLDDDPFRQFELWMEDAIGFGLSDPTAMTVATVDSEGQPAQRIVLLKQFSPAGFVFYTNYGSRKAADIENNAQVSLHFPWHEMDRQVHLKGTACKIPKAESFKYFSSRPFESQLSAWASRQSERINSRQFLLMQYDSMKKKFADGKVPLPDFWGGIRVAPSQMEFWQGSVSRLHDRFEYSLNSEGCWEIGRLSP